jgi:hypothetical protein
MHVRYHHVLLCPSDMRLHQNMYHCPSTCRSCTHFEAVFVATRCSCNASNESGCGSCWSFSASIVPALETNNLPSLGAFSVIRCEGFYSCSASLKYWSTIERCTRCTKLKLAPLRVQTRSACHSFCVFRRKIVPAHSTYHLPNFDPWVVNIFNLFSWRKHSPGINLSLLVWPHSALYHHIPTTTWNNKSHKQINTPPYY